jgi:hypothetical protein
MALRFFITRPREQGASPEKKSSPVKVYGYSDESDLPCKNIPDVVLFGGMTQAYCKSLAMAIYYQEGVRMRVPSEYRHPGYHGDEVTLSYAELIQHLKSMIGPFDHLPPGAVVSMEHFFDYLKKKVFSQKDKNPLTPH